MIKRRDKRRLKLFLATAREDINNEKDSNYDDRNRRHWSKLPPVVVKQNNIEMPLISSQFQSERNQNNNGEQKEGDDQTRPSSNAPMADWGPIVFYKKYRESYDEDRSKLFI